MTTAAAVKTRPIPFSGPMVRAILAGKKAQTRRVMDPQPIERHGRITHWQEKTRGLINESLGEPPGEFEVIAMPYCPYGKVGDRLWVRESWRTHERQPDMVDGILYAADGAFRPIENTRESADAWVDAHDNGKHGDHWRSGRFMRRWMARITLEITDVRVQRVQEISESDAIAEGVEFEIPAGAIPENIKFPEGFERRTPEQQEDWFKRTASASYMAQCTAASNAIEAFRKLWDSLNAGRGFGWANNPWVWCLTFKVLSPALAAARGVPAGRTEVEHG